MSLWSCNVSGREERKSTEISHAVVHLETVGTGIKATALLERMARVHWLDVRLAWLLSLMNCQYKSTSYSASRYYMPFGTFLVK